MNVIDSVSASSSVSVDPDPDPAKILPIQADFDPDWQQ
jgi:hypothetical protein